MLQNAFFCFLIIISLHIWRPIYIPWYNTYRFTYLIYNEENSFGMSPLQSYFHLLFYCTPIILKCSLLLFLELICWLIRSLLSPSLTPILFSSFLSPLFLFVSFSFPLDLSTPWYYPFSPYLFICILLCLCLSLCLFSSLSLFLSLSFSFPLFFLSLLSPSLTLPIFLG